MKTIEEVIKNKALIASSSSVKYIQPYHYHSFKNIFIDNSEKSI